MPYNKQNKVNKLYFQNCYNCIFASPTILIAFIQCVTKYYTYKGHLKDKQKLFSHNFFGVYQPTPRNFIYKSISFQTAMWYFESRHGQTEKKKPKKPGHERNQNWWKNEPSGFLSSTLGDDYFYH